LGIPILFLLFAFCLSSFSEDCPRAEPSIVVEKNVATPMRDGVVLRADVYRPAAVGKYPMLLQRTPYNKNFNLISTLLLDVMRAASEGYVVVIQDSRGRYASEGEFYPFRDDMLDGYDTVDMVRGAVVV
jgi:predicted acyl esterase